MEPRILPWSVGEPAALRGWSHIVPRGDPLSRGGIAGVVVGCVVAVALLGVCLYPFIIRRIKKKQRHSGPSSLDPETAMVPGSAGPQHLQHGAEASRRLSSRDSFAAKTDGIPGVERQFTNKELAFGGGHGGTKLNGARPERGFSTDHPPNMGSRRQTGFSLGHAQTFRSDGTDHQMEGIELSTTRADGLEYSDAMVGHSADYYSPTIPSEAFGMVTPPATDEVPSAAARRRSSSRTNSLRFSLMSIMRRMSTKESATPTSPISPGGLPPIRTMGPPPVPGPIASQGISESPTSLTSPGLPNQPQVDQPGLASPIRLTSSPPRPGRPDPAPREASPSHHAYIPPPVPTPGTVNPMDVMAPANEAEHNWHTNQQLYHLEHFQSLPAQHPPPNHNLPDHSENSTPKPSGPVRPATPSTINSQDAPTVRPAASSIPNVVPQPATQDMEMTNLPIAYDYSHLMPANGYQNGYALDGDYSSRSDRSTPLHSHSSSGPSTHATPDTRITDSSPSPRSDGASDLRSSASPYPGIIPSPRSFVCDECHREFDQVHKLNHHKRYHERPHECVHDGCGKRFGTKTHLDRHINDKHKKTRKYHCTEPSCAYSKAGGRFFPRKDNWRRHMMNIHSVNPQYDPEPDIIDDEMAGV